ncbi:MAG: GPR endopeptidase [Clostridiales bacterium]|nr:GPR endopeptidase [Clostridiales bacterium]
MGLYTDLALEAREMNPELDGVTEEKESFPDITITRIAVTNEYAAEKIGKKMGKYVTLDAPGLIDRPLDLFEELSKKLASELQKVVDGFPNSESILVVGLGNRSVTPDSLGPKVVEKVYVTRHVKQYMPDAFRFPVPSVASAAPGVLGSTGIETFEIVKGMTDRIKPDLVIAIDSLASRRASRISTTVQLSDAGIDPGSGVGNIRRGLNIESLDVPVIAIGVPLVVYASTITQDTISMIADETGLHGDEDKLKELAEKVVSERMDGMIVTPKDIDSIVGDMSGIIADGINMALYRDHYDDVRMLIA